jgi:hypothetical protein
MWKHNIEAFYGRFSGENQVEYQKWRFFHVRFSWINGAFSGEGADDQMVIGNPNLSVHRRTWEPNHPERPKGYVVSLTSKRRAETADRIHIYHAEAAEVCFSITFAMRIAPKWPEVEDFT